MEGTPVPVVFFNSPVAKEASAVPFNLPTVVERLPALLVRSPVSAGMAAVGSVVAPETVVPAPA
jgi:hypothetical protein